VAGAVEEAHGFETRIRASVAFVLRPERSRILDLVQSLHLPVGGGFVRGAVWDHLPGLPPSKPDGDVDVIWFDQQRAQPIEDGHLEQRLRELNPDINWSVKNQSRCRFAMTTSPILRQCRWPSPMPVAIRGDHGGGNV
jgi:hypothetical protein